MASPSTLLLSMFLLFGLIFLSYASPSANDDDGHHGYGFQDPPITIPDPSSEPYVDVTKPAWHGGHYADDDVGEDDDSGRGDHHNVEFQTLAIHSTGENPSSEPYIDVTKPAWHGGHYADDDVGGDDDDDDNDEIRRSNVDGDDDDDNYDEDDDPTSSYIAIPTPTSAPTPKPRSKRATKPTPRPRTTKPKPKPKPKQKRAPRTTKGRAARPQPNPDDEFDPSQATKPQPIPRTTDPKNSTQSPATATNSRAPFSGGIIKHRRIKA